MLYYFSLIVRKDLSNLAPLRIHVDIWLWLWREVQLFFQLVLSPVLHLSCYNWPMHLSFPCLHSDPCLPFTSLGSCLKELKSKKDIAWVSLPTVFWGRFGQWEALPWDWRAGGKGTGFASTSTAPYCRPSSGSKSSGGQLWPSSLFSMLWSPAWWAQLPKLSKSPFPFSLWMALTPELWHYSFLSFS